MFKFINSVDKVTNLPFKLAVIFFTTLFILIITYTSIELYESAEILQGKVVQFEKDFNNLKSDVENLVNTAEIVQPIVNKYNIMLKKIYEAVAVVEQTSEGINNVANVIAKNVTQGVDDMVNNVSNLWNVFKKR